jgi:hypothetical protein
MDEISKNLKNEFLPCFFGAICFWYAYCCKTKSNKTLRKSHALSGIGGVTESFFKSTEVCNKHTGI